ncbi:MAG: hypothetical protein WCP10_10935 [Desulfuromonadales bacterium]
MKSYIKNGSLSAKTYPKGDIMSEYTGSNILEKIGSFIPGYKGYSEKEGRRDTDKILRVEIARMLDSTKESIEKMISSCVECKNMHDVVALDKIKRNIDTTANKIRYASYGASGFFDVVQIGNIDLEALYRHDLSIKQTVEVFLEILNKCVSEKTVEENDLVKALDCINNQITDRDKVIMEVR